VQDLLTLFVGRRGVHEQKILPDRARKELRVLGDESDTFTQSVQVDVEARNAVVQDQSSLRAVESHQQLDESGLAGARRPDKRNGLSPIDGE
jgi:hypothetical protein